MSLFARNLKEIRKAKKLSQASLAEKLHVSQTAVYYWESGKREPGIDMLFNISDVLGVGVDELVGLEEQEFSPDEYKPTPEENENLNVFVRPMGDKEEIEEMERSYEEIIKAMHFLNLHGQKEAVKRIRELTHIKEYTEGVYKLQPK